MIFLITGATHTGKTYLAQRLIERHAYPMLSLDHLKMGLIRSGQTTLTPSDDDELTGYLWPIAREMVKTAWENKQNLILEGCYIPPDWAEDFTPEQRAEIRCVCLAMDEAYLQSHFADVVRYANVVEQRLDDGDCTPEFLQAENAQVRALWAGRPELLLITEEYDQDRLLAALESTAVLVMGYPKEGVAPSPMHDRKKPLTETTRFL